MSLRVVVRLMIIEAVRALSRNLVRSGLAMLGIAVAVAIVITVIAMGRASIEASEAELDKLGDNLVWVEAGSRNVAGARTGTHGMTTLTARDADAIRRELPLIKDVSENVDGGFLVIYQDHNWRTRWRGVAPAYREIKRPCAASCLPTSIRSARSCGSRIWASRSSACSRPRASHRPARIKTTPS